MLLYQLRRLVQVFALLWPAHISSPQLSLIMFTVCSNIAYVCTRSSTGQPYVYTGNVDPVWTMFDLAPEGRGQLPTQARLHVGVRQMMPKEVKG